MDNQATEVQEVVLVSNSHSLVQMRVGLSTYLMTLQNTVLI